MPPDTAMPDTAMLSDTKRPQPETVLQAEGKLLKDQESSQVMAEQR